MKKIVFLICVLTSFIANTQIVRHETSKDSIVWKRKTSTLPKLYFFQNVDTAQNRYTFYFKNYNYQYITDVQYISLGDLKTTKEFFVILQEVISKEEKVTITLDGKTWSINKSMGSVYVMSNNSSFLINKNEIENIIEILNK